MKNKNELKFTNDFTRLKQFIDEKYLLFIIFITGASVLIIEILAIRILSTYFGNTLYSTSSIISVVLGALSFGYYFGGKNADKNPSINRFFNIIFLSGISILILEILVLTALPYAAYFFSPIYGPLIASLILFSVPGFLLGTLSPYVIKLESIRNKNLGIGEISGEVFFVSTLGSILGSLLTGFVLIPNFGIKVILVSTSLILIVIGFLGSIDFNSKKKEIFKKTFLISLLISLTFSFQAPRRNGEIFKDDGLYQQITVFDDEHEGKQARFLAQDIGLSSAVYLDSPELAFEYTKYYELYKLFDVDLKNALFIGGGAYSTPHKILNELSNVKVAVSEIEPLLFPVAKNYFGVSDNKRLKNIILDGRRFLHKSKETYDLIFSDAYSSIYSVPNHLTTIEFFNMVSNRLSENGVFMINIIGSLSRKKDSLIFSEINTFKEVFPNSYFFAVDCPSKTTLQNIIFVGVKGNNQIYFDSKVGIEIESKINGIRKKLINLNRFDLSKYPILTDDFSPTDYLTAKIVRQRYSDKEINFDAGEAYNLISQQVDLDSRYLGSDAHEEVVNLINSELDTLSDEVRIQRWEINGIEQKYELTNIVGKLDFKSEKRIILATHYDTKKYADLDSKNPKAFMPGANDSASGVSVLLEVARFLKNSSVKPRVNVDFVFFDGEEGDPEGERRNWYPLGSDYFARNLKSFYSDKLPELGIVVDMVCDKDLDIYLDRNSYNSAREEVDKFFDLASKKYPRNFIKSTKYTIIDDHVPLIKAGIPSFVLIDFDYPYWHTTKDTLDKCSKESLEKIGKSLIEYIYSL